MKFFKSVTGKTATCTLIYISFYFRTLDIKAKKHHIPLVDRTPTEPPPVVVAIVGPPKVGKSTLLQCVVKNFTKQKLSKPQGPVTVVSGRISLC